jgi:hypothetical protein
MDFLEEIESEVTFCQKIENKMNGFSGKKRK